MAGFNYQRPGPIQYGRINPYAGLTEGVSRGMALGAQMQRNAPSDVVIADPGTWQDYDKSMFFQNESKDLANYRQWEKDAKSDDPAIREQYFKDLEKSGAMQSRIMAGAIKAGYKPKEIEETLTSVINNDETAVAKINKLKTLLKKKDPAAYKDLLAKENEIKAARIGQLEGVLGSIIEYHEDPRKYQGRTGRVNEATTNVIRKEDQYIAELYQLDPARAKAYLEQRRGQRGGRGGSSTERTRLMNVFKSLHKEAAMIDPVLEEKALSAIAVLTQPGAIPYWKLNKIMKEYDTLKKEKGGKKKSGGSKQLVVGQIYPTKDGRRLKFLGYNKEGDKRWKRVK